MPSSPRTRRHAARRRLLLLIAAPVAAAVVLAGCGNAKTISPHRSIGVVLTEYRVTPNAITATPGVLTFIVHNLGRRTHNLVVTFDGRTIGASKPLWPGQRDRFTVVLIPGRYTFASTILQDQALGTYGTLTVS